MLYFNEKYTKFDFGWGSFQCSPLAGLKGSLLLRKGSRGGWKGGKGREGEGKVGIRRGDGRRRGGQAQKGLQHQAHLGLNPALLVVGKYR